jgi:hypothetical protein
VTETILIKCLQESNASIVTFKVIVIKAHPRGLLLSHGLTTTVAAVGIVKVTI